MWRQGPESSANSFPYPDCLSTALPVAGVPSDRDSLRLLPVLCMVSPSWTLRNLVCSTPLAPFICRLQGVGKWGVLSFHSLSLPTHGYYPTGHRVERVLTPKSPSTIHAPPSQVPVDCGEGGVILFHSLCHCCQTGPYPCPC